MLAKYDGKCEITGQEIKAGVTEIDKIEGKWVLADVKKWRDNGEIRHQVIEMLTNEAEQYRNESRSHHKDGLTYSQVVDNVIAEFTRNVNSASKVMEFAAMRRVISETREWLSFIAADLKRDGLL